MIERVDFSNIEPVNGFSRETKKKVARADIKLFEKEKKKPVGKELYILQVYKVMRWDTETVHRPPVSWMSLDIV